ncbi:hypothetical protein [Streptomyces sporangiiformans]|uniref:DUF3761 domain-containing protein n=1 Tax=Streptomyces sporangiiformans TaxID=2315329 RepID=A0A505D0X9_9ACTN|nr:hypothetical protein [Streptomyces sporangiiformans]TPQ15812.1 hypothetical protein FGD71_044945 [Streptomyces sporangiiformans]
MTDPNTTPMPPAPRPPDTRPLRKRKRVWLGSSGLFIAGALIAAPGNGGQQPVEARVKPATTITATVTATPEPGPTVTATVKAKAKPRPTVTVTETAAAQAADTNSGSEDSVGTCSIVSNSGNCYAAGQFCRNSDHGAVTTTASGAEIKCAYSSNAWRWTYA